MKRKSTAEEVEDRNKKLPKTHTLMDAMHYHGNSARVELLINRYKEITVMAYDKSADFRFAAVMRRERPTTRVSDTVFYWFCGDRNDDIPGKDSAEKSAGLFKRLHEAILSVDVKTPRKKLFTAPSAFSSYSKFQRLSDVMDGVHAFKYNEKRAGVYGEKLEEVEAFMSTNDGDVLQKKGKHGRTWLLTRSRYEELVKNNRLDLKKK